MKNKPKMFDNKKKLKDQKTHKTQNTGWQPQDHDSTSRSETVGLKSRQVSKNTQLWNRTTFELFIIIIIIIVNYFLLFDVGWPETPKSRANVQSIN